jgi:hypothetical protein
MLKLPEWSPPQWSDEDHRKAAESITANAGLTGNLAGECLKLSNKVTAPMEGFHAFCDAREVHAMHDKAMKRIVAASGTTKLLALRSLKDHYQHLLDLREKHYAEQQARAQVAQLAEHKRLHRVQQLIEFGQREGRALTAAVDRLQERLTILRGKLAPDRLAEWVDLLDEALDSCRGSVSAALAVSPGGNVTVRKEAA